MKAQQFNHFIITRFNLRQNIWKADKKGQLVNNFDWLKDRYNLFQQYCLPSISAQTEQNFKWLVYFDVETPTYFKKENDKIHKSFLNFLPLYVENFKQFELQLFNDIINYLDTSKPFIITTRLDNDDCFHKNTIKAIQLNFVAKHKTIIDLKRGLRLQVFNPIKMSVEVKNSGPFISLITKLNNNENNLTVYDREHDSWTNEFDFVSLEKDIYWLQIIHKRNIVNKVGENLSFDRFLLKGFDFLENIKFSINYRVFVLLRRTKRKLIGCKLWQ